VNDNGVTILIVDDEPSIVAVTAQHLTRKGYEALVAVDGNEALAMLEARAEVDLVLANRNGSRISGPELDRIIPARWPHIKIIAMSGRPRSTKLPNGVAFLPKPFRSANLIAVIESVLCPEAA
jgi:CheY-like chemotaxis protein